MNANKALRRSSVGRRRRTAGWLAGFFVVAIGAFVGIAWWSGQQRENTASAVAEQTTGTDAGSWRSRGDPPAPAAREVKHHDEIPAADARTVTGDAAREQLRKSGQYESLAAAFQAARYAVEKIDPTGPHSRGAQFFAANPGQQLRAWFRHDGIELASGRAPAKGADEEGVEPWNVALRLRATGRASAMTAVGPRVVRAEGNRVEMTDASAAVTEWYENRRDGIEQGFTVTRALGGAGALELVMAVEGNVRAQSVQGKAGEEVGFFEAGGEETVRCKGLKAWDATGRALTARMEPRGADLALIIADAGAHYPVTIDPLFANVEARLVEESVAGDNFGFSVALSGATALVGARLDDTAGGVDAGSSYVFVRSGTVWTQQAKLTAADGAIGDNFGSSVALSGPDFLTELFSAADNDTQFQSFLFLPTDTAAGYAVARQSAAAFPSDPAGGAVLALTDDSSLQFTPPSGRSFLLFGVSYGSLFVGSNGYVTFGSGDNTRLESLSTHFTLPRIAALFDDLNPAAAGQVSVKEFSDRVAVTWQNVPEFNLPGGNSFQIELFFDGRLRITLLSLTSTDGLIGLSRGGGVPAGFFESNFSSYQNTASPNICDALVGSGRDDAAAGTDAGSVYVFVRQGTTWSQQAKLTAGDAAPDDRFGSAVAVSGDTTLVGAFRDDTAAGSDAGSAYVFVRNGTTWSQQTRLTAGGAAPGDGLGTSVALSGDTALVGAEGDDTAAGADAGSAFVYVRTGTVWSQQAQLTASGAAPDDRFGTAVALSGETALVGAFLDDTAAGSNAGSAYVFLRNGTVWSQQAQLTASDAAAGDLFGYSVALSGDTALVGAYAGDTGSGPDAGSAFVFVRSGTVWNQQTKLTDSQGAAFEEFGWSVALSGNTALVGVFFDDGFAGSALVFVRNGTAWSQEVKLTAGDSPAEDGFGNSVAVSGNTALVGAKEDDTVAGTNVGSVYVFIRSGTVWSQQAKLNAGDGSIGGFGISVALNADTALVGVDFAVTGAGAAAGSAYVFVRNGTVWSQQARLTATDAAPIDRFGTAVALSGETALVGAFLDDTAAGTDAGSAYIFVRSGLVWSQQAKLTASDGAGSDSFGGSVALSADTALVGVAADDTTAGTDAGSAYVFVRNGTAWSQQTKLTAGDAASMDSFGSSVALNTDTALIGASSDDTPAGTDAGSAYVFVRSGTAWSQQAKLTAADAASVDRFGASVALLADMALIGAPEDDAATGTEAGSAYVFSRSGPIWTQQVKLTSGVDASAGDYFGSSVALSGDTALVGTRQDDTTALDAGSAYIFLLGELPNITIQPVSRTVVPGTSVTFSVTATGYAPLRYQWRRNGFEIENANASSYTIQVPQQAPFDAVQGSYDVVVSNLGGVATSAPALLGVNALSQFTQTFPGAPLSAQGVLIVNLAPTGVTGLGWRLTGEQQWRLSGVAMLGLTTGDRTVEFRPVPGYYQPVPEPVSIVSGGPAIVLDREYYEVAGSGGSGGIIVTLKPESVLALGAQWRLLGENDTQWRNSGATAGGLLPGAYLVECKAVAGRTTPPPFSVAVQDGPPSTAVATYFLADAPVGTPPGVLPFEVVTTSQSLPYAFVGQIRSAAGVSTGFVVKARVVATAAHVVWDDGTLSAATGLQWLFQRDRGIYEPVPQIPRGFYLLDGYAAQRIAENTPGESSPQSQTLDAAAMYFLEDTSRGGFGGFLASDAANNEWLLSPRNKTLVGYPVDGIAPANQGRMHATPVANVAFASAFGRTFTTADITSEGGNSGGPLCVQYDDGRYFPAAIYLGGTAQTVVRAIDGMVKQVFELAELSSIDGEQHTGGGITHVSAPQPGGGLQVASIKVNLVPTAAASGGARWRLGSPSNTARTTGFQLDSQPPCTTTLYFTAVSGFLTPPSAPVTLTGGNLLTVNRTYFGITTQPQDRTVTAFTNTSFSVAVSGTPLAYQWRRNGVNISGATGATLTRTNVTAAQAGSYTVRVTWTEGAGTVFVDSAIATLTVNPASQAIAFASLPNRLLGDPPFALSASASSGLSVSFAVLSGPATFGGGNVTVTDFGTVTIRATQPGTADYNAATPVDRAFQVVGETFDAWRSRFFTTAELSNPLISGPTADLERDGLFNLLEFALNLDPKASDATPMIPGTGTRGLPVVSQEDVAGQPRVVVEYVRRRAAGSPGITYRIEFTSDLNNPAAWSTVGTEAVTPIDQTWERVRFTDAQAAAPRRFGHLVVTQP